MGGNLLEDLHQRVPFHATDPTNLLLAIEQMRQ